MEIERKYLVSRLPENLDQYQVRLLEQGYLCTGPTVRIRQDNDRYELTYKSWGLLAREEYNLPLTAESYAHLLTKVDGRVIRKRRYMVPLNEELTAELDVFEGELAPLMLVEVEFKDTESALAFEAPDWFGDDVTFSGLYQNSRLSRLPIEEIRKMK